MVRLFFVCIVFVTTHCWGLLYPQTNIEKVLDQAGAVLIGKVIAQSEVLEGNAKFIQTTFEVVKWYKGSSKAQISIRQFGSRDANGKFKVFRGLSVFHPHQTYLLFLDQVHTEPKSRIVDFVTFGIFAKNNDDIQNASPNVQIKSSRALPNFFRDIGSVKLKNQISNFQSQGKLKKDQFAFEVIDDLIKKEVAK